METEMHGVVQFMDSLIEIVGEMIDEVPNKEKAKELREQLDYSASHFRNACSYYR